MDIGFICNLVKEYIEFIPYEFSSELWPHRLDAELVADSHRNACKKHKKIVGQQYRPL